MTFFSFIEQILLHESLAGADPKQVLEINKKGSRRLDV